MHGDSAIRKRILFIADERFNLLGLREAGQIAVETASPNAA